ncbi:hypothetical protein G3050_004659 [Salmonella enterica]|nr:hypothetical protein [Salmonella enterica subsp. enterica serovar Montevideo]
MAQHDSTNHPGLHMPQAATSWASCLFVILTPLSCNLVVVLNVVNNFMWFERVAKECKDYQKKEVVWKTRFTLLITHRTGTSYLLT